MSDIYVLDTNVLLDDPDSLFNYGSSDIYLPIQIIEELDKFKSGNSMLSRNARSVIRKLESLRIKGNLNDGVKLGKHHGLLRVFHSGYNVSSNYVDDTILEFMKFITKKVKPNKSVVLVTKDVNLRLKADIKGFSTLDYTNSIGSEITYNISHTIDHYLDLPEVNKKEFIDTLFSNGIAVSPYDINKFNPNTYFTIGPNRNILVKYRNKMFYKLRTKIGVKSIKARNVEQVFLMDAITDFDIDLVFVVGSTGSGKTLVSVAAALRLLELKKHKRLFLARSIVPLAGNKYNSIGFLPGDLDDKMDPWYSSYYDSLDYILGDDYQTMINNGTIKLGLFTYLRGRTLSDSVILIDEAQNTTRLEMKSIISRVGENSKIIVMGDPNQIDSPYLSKFDNGLIYALSKLRDDAKVAVIYLNKVERSYIANLSELL